MKAIITITALLVLATPASAERTSAQKCEELATYAASIMNARQRGMSEYQARTPLRDWGIPEGVRLALSQLIDKAYDTPIVSQQEKPAVIATFRNDMRRLCLS